MTDQAKAASPVLSECAGAGWFTEQFAVGEPYGFCPFCDRRVPCDNRGQAIRHPRQDLTDPPVPS